MSPKRRDGARRARSAAQSRRRGTKTAGAVELDAVREAIGYNIRRADVYMLEQFKRMLAGWKIRPAEYSILRLIESNASATQAAIADALHIRRQNIVGVIARLERIGFVRREVDANDRRRHALALTKKGERQLADLKGAARKMDAEVTRCWSAAERATVVRLLQRLYDR